MSQRHSEMRFWSAMLVLGLLRLTQIGAIVFGVLLLGRLLSDAFVAGANVTAHRLLPVILAAAIGWIADAGCILVGGWTDKDNDPAAPARP